MAQYRTVVHFDVQPIESEDVLEGLRIQRYEQTKREASNGRTLDHGEMEEAGRLDIPLHQVPEVIRDMVSWLGWFSNAEAMRLA